MLDLVAVAPDGTLAAYVGMPYDASNRLGSFEPVCTHPDHRRRRLACVLMLEGIRRLRSIGAIEAMVFQEVWNRPLDRMIRSDLPTP